MVKFCNKTMKKIIKLKQNETFQSARGGQVTRFQQLRGIKKVVFF